MAGLIQHDGGPGYFYFEYELKELSPYIPARYWDGTYRDRIRDTHDNPQYWTEEDYQYGTITTPDLIAQHLDKTPNVA